MPHAHAARTPILLALCLIAGCATTPTSQPPTHATSSAGDFQAAKDAIRDAGFELDRVDAERGIITSWPRASAGLATPWLPHARTLSDSVENLIQPDRRIVEVTFAVANDGALVNHPDAGASTPPRLRDVRVRIYRLSRPLHRLDATGIRLASTALDPRKPGLSDGELIYVGDDPRLASWLRERILRAASDGK